MSNTNNRIGSKAALYVRTDSNGMYTSPGPFVGIVKNNFDPTCTGRLQVYIPQLGAADENNPGNWITVSYASPFRGQTKRRINVAQYVDQSIDSNADENSTTENSFQSYGMWFVPPDINIKVLCVFVNGDPSQGYWIACIQDAFDSHMIPAVGSSAASSDQKGGYLWDPAKLKTHADLQQYIQLASGEIPSRLPTAEAVLNNVDTASNVNKIQMVPLVYQTKQLAIQGLVFDQGRGTTTASSVRESPSQVFGFSSPGRLSVFKDAQTSKKLLSQIQQYVNDKTTLSDSDKFAVETALASSYRTGGHQIVLDDGSVEGKDQGIRIRTASGNMVQLDDTNGQIYIINASGSAWIEMSPSGKIDVFSQSDFSLRSQGDINLHSDKNIIMNAGASIQMQAGSELKLDSSSTLSLRSSNHLTAYSQNSIQMGSAGALNLSSAANMSLHSDAILNLNGSTTNINCASGIKVSDPGKIATNNLVEVAQSGNKVWWKNGKIVSAVNRAPTHEPWPNHEVNSIVTSQPVTGVVDKQPISRPKSSDTVRKALNEAHLINQPDPLGTICGLNKDQTKALLAAIGHSESGGKYNIINKIGFSGKYQFGKDALITAGYIKTGTKGKTIDAVKINSNWTGKNGVNSLQDWLTNGSAQEEAMMILSKLNCNFLKRHGIITDKSPVQEIGGYMYCAHFSDQYAVDYWKLRTGQPGGADHSDGYGGLTSKTYAVGSHAMNLAGSVSKA